MGTSVVAGGVVVEVDVVVMIDVSRGRGASDTEAWPTSVVHPARNMIPAIAAPPKRDLPISCKATTVNLDEWGSRWLDGAMDRASFTSMDVSTKEEWMTIARETANNQSRVAETVLGLLRSLATIEDGFVTDQLTHALQTATRAERAGASDEVVVAALCHDIGKAISVPNHPAIAAAILEPYVSPEVHFMIAAHQDFQGKHYYEHFGMNPDARAKHDGHPAYELATRFADEWDQKAFDPNYDTLPLEHFEDRVRAVFAKPRFMATR